MYACRVVEPLLKTAPAKLGRASRDGTRQGRRALVAASVVVGLLGLGCLPELRVFPTETTGPRCGDGFISVGTEAAGGSAEACDPGETKAVGCSPTCTLECEGGISVATRHCYFVAGKATTFTAASELCVAASAHLVTFSGDDEVRSVESAAPTAAADYWVGLLRDSNGVYAPEGRDEPGHPAPPDRGPCSGCFGRVDEKGTFPDATSEAGCLVATPGLRGPWKGVPCNKGSKPYDVVCEREPPGARGEPCTGGICIRLTFPDKRYLYVPSPASGAEARDACRSLGGLLVVLDSAEEREELARELSRFVGPEANATVWVGLARTTQEGPFMWENGKPETLKFWGEREPKPTTAPARAYVDLKGTAYDRRLLRAGPEDGLRSYICQY